MGTSVEFRKQSCESHPKTSQWQRFTQRNLCECFANAFTNRVISKIRMQGNKIQERHRLRQTEYQSIFAV